MNGDLFVYFFLITKLQLRVVKCREGIPTSVSMPFLFRLLKSCELMSNNNDP